MKRQRPHLDPTLLPASLNASNVGTWDYDPSLNRLRYCRAMAVLFNLPFDQAAEGIPIDQLAAAIHPEDRGRSRAKRMHMLQHGGTFVIEYRVLPSPSTMRWVLARGHYELDETGRIFHGRGIVVDITESKQEGFADGDVFFLTEASAQTMSALDRVTRHVLAAQQALGDIDPTETVRLRSVLDALLVETAHHIAGTMVPVVTKRTQH